MEVSHMTASETSTSHINVSTSGAPDVVAGLFHAVDDLDWEGVRSSLTSKLALDYTSLWGGQPQELDVDDVIMSWRQLLPGFDATQHLIGPVVVARMDERGAVCTTNVRAYHHIVDGDDSATWMLAGRYVITLDHGDDGWKISGITLHTAYEDGSRSLAGTATERVAAGRGRSPAVR
jgi:hypothetical protein